MFRSCRGSGDDAMVTDYYAMLGIDPGADVGHARGGAGAESADLVVGNAEPEEQTHVPVVS